jgi:DHA1 family bicyclomycin/chloramphenicol resistance-like MFS transporter
VVTEKVGLRLPLLLVLGGLSAFGPLCMDLYLPGLPQLASEYGTDPAAVQLTITACLLGLALGQLVGGSLADLYGRRKPLLWGLAAFVLSSALCSLAPTVPILTGLRLLQGLAGGFGIVVSRAIVADRYSGVRAARVFSLLMVVNGTVPILAPIAGGQLLRVTDWRGVFWVLTGVGALLLLATIFVIDETLPERPREGEGGLARTIKGFGELLRQRRFVGQVLTSGFTFGALMAYISGSTFALQQTYGLTAQQFSLAFGLNGLGIVAFGQLNSRLLKYLSLRQLALSGLVTMAAGAVLFLTAVLVGLGLPVVLPALFLVVASFGMLGPNISALALSGSPRTAGSASALLGLGQYAFGGVTAPLVGLGGSGSAWLMATIIVSCAALAIVTFTVFTPAQSRSGPAFDGGRPLPLGRGRSGEQGVGPLVDEPGDELLGRAEHDGVREDLRLGVHLGEAGDDTGPQEQQSEDRGEGADGRFEQRLETPSGGHRHG